MCFGPFLHATIEIMLSESRVSSLVLVLVVIAVLSGIIIFNRITGVRRVVVDTPSISGSAKLFYKIEDKSSLQEEFNKFIAEVTARAEAGSQINIDDCVASPDVLLVEYGSNISVKNSGLKDINFGLEKENMILISGGQSIEVSIDFENGPGPYGYACENDTDALKAIGMVLVVE